MKITRKMLLIIIAVLGVLLIAYGLIRQFTAIEIDESTDKYVTNIIIFIALGLFVYNRKIASDEKRSREAEEAERLAKENQEEEDSQDEETP